MTKGRDARDGDGSTSGSTAPTMQAMPAARTPVPLAGSTGSPEPAIDSHADTAVASRSQRMSAQSQPALEAGEEVGEGALDGMVGTVLEQRYEIQRKIGQGGMGAVYEATHKLIGKRVAVKVLLDKYAQKDQIVARLEQEARLASSIGHSNIIDITDIGQTTDGRMFVVMEYLEGESLGALIGRVGRLEHGRAIAIARQVASALGAAHQKGIVHRDVKPENVFLLSRDGSRSDFVKVVDFGISKSLRPEDGSDSPRLTQTGMVLGTPLYMSPEQARGDEELDHRIDIYALGVILYEMVTGEVPFRGSNYLNILSQVLADEPPPPREHDPNISPDLEAVILKALEKDRSHRYQSMQELAADLSLLEGDSLSTTGARITASRRRRKRAPHSPLKLVGWVAAVSVTIAAVVVTVGAMMGSGGKDKAAPIAAALPGPDAGPAKPPPDAGPVKPKVELAKVRIVSRPPGVEVFAGGRSWGLTPTTWEGEKERIKVTLVGSKDGFDDREMVINPMVDDGRKVTLVLKKARRGRGKRLDRGDTRPGPTGPRIDRDNDLLPPGQR
jgi:serine/threonine-protein kinase